MASINPLELMNMSKIPIIAVNQKYERFKLNKIILPIRNVQNWFHKIPFAASLANLSGAKIFIIGLQNDFCKNSNAKLEEKILLCKNYLSKYDLNFEVEKFNVKKNMLLNVLDLAKHKKADLIVVSPPLKYNKLKSYFDNYLYSRLISKGTTPVMGITLT